ncbi:MAG: type II secretion system ATPase GspE [Hyphomonadaceae bacterium]|nr:type II secretion system ATPase GspE [Hyphomonadaceae bacterium]
MDSGPSVGKLNYAYAKENGVVLLNGEDGPVLGYRPDAAPMALVEARRAVGQKVRMQQLDPATFERTLSEVYATAGLDGSQIDDALEADGNLGSLAAGLDENADLLDNSEDAPVIRLINGLIAEAVRSKASDIHIEPYEDRLSIRLRIDGVMREVLSQSRRVAPLLVSRIKVMGRLDIAEKRIPQDGRISLSLGSRAIDVRVSTLPSRYGERVVLRLLDKQQARLDLVSLGMPEEMLERMYRLLAQPNGIILVTGPTGSGKTTTLYAALTHLNDNSRNILTVEDPIEYGLDGVGQTQVNTKVGMTFVTGLRAILRQDPDVVMVGEIRDAETAEIAVQASLTGHLVLSTVHTNSAAAAITRLRDMGVESFLLASTVAGILAQRLVRRLCEHCKTPYQADAAELAMLGLPPGEARTFWHAQGCPECGGRGFEGRIGLYELIVTDPGLRTLIHDDAREQQLEDHALSGGQTLLAAGVSHVLAGRTSVGEVMRVVRPGGDDNGGV